MNKSFLLVLFLFSTGLFIYQHSSGLSWDFSVYLLNSRYLFSGVGFFEIGRPPLASFLMVFGEYVYIVLVSLLALFGVVKFSERYRLRVEVFYAFLLSPFVLVSAFSVGTELLSLALLLLVLAFIDTGVSGFFIGLSFLSHYNNLVNAVFFFAKRNSKEFLKSVLFAFIVLVPWLLINYFLKGDVFYSFLDQFVKNVAARDYIVMPVDFTHFILILGFSLPFFLVGVSRSLRKPSRIDYLLFLFLALKVGSYVFIPFKTARYLFLIALPVAYFATKGLARFNYRVAFLVFIASLILLPVAYFNLESPVMYYRAASLIDSSCMTSSSNWVLLNYIGVSSAPAPREELVNYYLSEGYTLVLFKNVFDPPYVLNESFISSLPVSYEDSDFIIINSSKCLPSFDYRMSYIEERNLTSNLLYNESFSFTVWDII